MVFAYERAHFLRLVRHLQPGCFYLARLPILTAKLIRSCGSTLCSLSIGRVAYIISKNRSLARRPHISLRPRLYGLSHTPAVSFQDRGFKLLKLIALNCADEEQIENPQ